MFLYQWFSLSGALFFLMFLVEAPERLRTIGKVLWEHVLAGKYFLGRLKNCSKETFLLFPPPVAAGKQERKGSSQPTGNVFIGWQVDPFLRSLHSFPSRKREETSTIVLW